MLNVSQVVSYVSYFCCCNGLHALPLPGDQAMDALTTRLPFSPRHIGLSDSTTIAILCALIELITESLQNAKLVKVDHITMKSRLCLCLVSCGF